MLKSMTGFGRGQASDQLRRITVEIKSVNNRYLDTNIRMPRKYSAFEENIRGLVKKVARRGKVEVNVNFESLSIEDVGLSVNEPVAKQYAKTLADLGVMCGLSTSVSLEYLASQPDVIQKDGAVTDQGELLEVLESATKQALDAHDNMKRVEGQKLAEDMAVRCDNIEKIVEEIAARAPQLDKEYYQRLYDKIEKLLEDKVEMPEERILTEAAVFADKANITEEIVRMRSHLAQFRDNIEDAKGGEGKMLDFIIQEMNRETNTIGSKANDLEITNKMLRLKQEIEKLREQVQNVE